MTLNASTSPVLVTGATGPHGGAVSRALLAAGAELSGGQVSAD